MGKFKKLKIIPVEEINQRIDNYKKVKKTKMTKDAGKGWLDSSMLAPSKANIAPGRGKNATTKTNKY